MGNDEHDKGYLIINNMLKNVLLCKSYELSLNLNYMSINKLLKWQNTHICLKWQKVAKHFQLLKKKGGAIVDMNYSF
jgi:hypothetical protein